MKLYRPHIPLEVRCEVAARQAGYDKTSAAVLLSVNTGRFKALLGPLLMQVSYRLGCKVNDLHLDHDPALATRTKRSHFNGKRWIAFYSPDANDPAYLIYREKHAHQIKTNVRGEHGQFPDRVLIKRERKRRNKNKGKVKRKVKIKSSGFDKTRSRRFDGTIKQRRD